MASPSSWSSASSRRAWWGWRRAWGYERRMLTLEGVTKRFGGLTAVREVSFTVGAGDLLGIIGPNGAGKTTLFNLIAGAYQPDGGRILFDGRDLAGLPAHAVCRLGLTRTFQLVKPFGN